MDNSLGMRGREGVGDLNRDIENRIGIQSLAMNHLLQAFALQFLHDDEGMPVVVVDIVNGADIRMVELGRSPRFAFETFQRLGVTYQIFGNELKRYTPSEAYVLRLVHNAHATASEFSQDAIVGDRLADHCAPIL